jgi:O-antigen/teichoic acid export membrane protein
MDSILRKMVKQSSHYFAGNIIIFLALLIALPIFTRIFSRAEYGIISIVTITVSILSVIALCGFPQSAVRFYHVFANRKGNSYYLTLLFGVFAFSFAVVGTFFLLTFFLSEYFNPLTILLFKIGALTVIPLNIITTILGFYRASQQTKAYNIVAIARTYGDLGLALFFVIALGMGLFGRFLGPLVASTAICIILLILLKKTHLAFADKGYEKISKPFLKEAFLYGYPLIFSAILSMLLTSGDRYIIQYVMDAAAVGVYSVGYAIPTMIQSLIVAPLNIAIVPILMEVWSEKGEQETKNLLSKLLKFYLMIAIPIIFGLTALAKDVVVVFATEKFVDAASVVPYVIVAVIIYGIYFITWAGLNIHKKTQVIPQYLLIAVIVNVALNFLLIPYYGIVGAAIATLIAYI